MSSSSQMMIAMPMSQGFMLPRWSSKRTFRISWSLFGLAESLREQKKNDDDDAARKAKFQTVWAKADVKITMSCLCQAKK